MDYALISGLAGLGIALACGAMCVVLFRRCRAGAMSAVEGVRDDCEKRGEEFRGVLASIEANMQAAEANMQTTEELLREGRLNRSVRAQALKMLRSGVAPDTAAGALGMATREMRLLARVSEMLCR